MSRWIDISVPLGPGVPVWPGDPPVRVEPVQDLDVGDEATVSSLSLTAHAGTHVDAPLHYLAGGAGIDDAPLSALIGAARVIELRSESEITREELAPHRIRVGERLLFKTRNSSLWEADGFQKDFVHLSTAAAQGLAAKGVRVVGIDYLSVGGYGRNETEVHRTLLKAGVWILEGLDLGRVRPGRYDLVCLPLRIAGGEAAPARAVLRPRGRAP